jgi:hypothetical protein
MDDSMSQDPESYIKLTSDVAWKPYSKAFKRNEDRIQAQNTAKVQTGIRRWYKVDSLTWSIATMRRVRE